MTWIVEDRGFEEDKVTNRGSKYMIGNGHLGYRGTLEEFTKERLPSCTLAGLYDQVGDSWRELVNAPNGLHTQLICDGEPLYPTTGLEEHSQSLDIRRAVFSRKTDYAASGGKKIQVAAERFASMENVHLLAMRYAWKCSHDCQVIMKTGIDGEVWDINGPHLSQYAGHETADGILSLTAVTGERGVKVAVAESFTWEQGEGASLTALSGKSAIREIAVDCKAGSTYRFTKFVSIYTDADDAGDPLSAAVSSCLQARMEGYDSHRRKHERHWENKWERSDVVIEGDEEAQLALRYSIYQLLIIAPYGSERLSIPARGLSGQVYKGAVFWDTEMFMLPFFLHTQPDVARNLVMYRVHTLDGARRKAREYGFRGAFYAWESQDSGDDACTLFNITDVFTNRPMRTYFRDKQIHISADVAYGIWQYCSRTGDRSVLLEGGAEVLWECARFFYSFSRFHPDLERYELLDVTGPDEYHERVHNNAYTNAMVKFTLDAALMAADILRNEYPDAYERLIAKLDFDKDLVRIAHLRDRLYVPSTDADTLLIEQFDGYGKLEDVPLAELKSRIIHKNEYLGGGSGLASTTRIIKQADVVLLMHLFPERYSRQVKKANWDYYEPRTEHGSSLSPCVYALVAADIGYTEWAYPYFKRTATVDLTGDSKQYVGTLYIGGTHPAANGGAWMAAVLGFAGIRFEEGVIGIDPALPSAWNSIRFNIFGFGQRFEISVSKDRVRVVPAGDNQKEQPFRIADRLVYCYPGKELTLNDVPKHGVQ